MRIRIQVTPIEKNSLKVIFREMGKGEGEKEYTVRVHRSCGIVRVSTPSTGEHTPYPSISISGSLPGMRSMYTRWEHAKVVRAFGSYHNVSSPSIHHPLDLLAYALEMEREPRIATDGGFYELSFDERYKTFQCKPIKKKDVRIQFNQVSGRTRRLYRNRTTV